MVLDLYASILSETVIKLITALLVLLIGIVLARFIGKLLQKILHNLEINKIIKEEAGMNIPLEESVSSFITYLLYLIVAIIALNQLGLASTVFTIILITIFLVILLFIILAVKDFIPNIMAGFFVHQRKLIKENDYIKVKNVEGKVIHISPTETKLKTKQGDTVFVPNISLIKNEIIKYKH